MNEFGRDPNSLTDPPNGSFHHVSDSKCIRDGADILPFDWSIPHDRGATDHSQLRHLGELGKNLILNPVCEIRIVLVAAQTRKRQNGNYLFHRICGHASLMKEWERRKKHQSEEKANQDHEHRARPYEPAESRTCERKSWSSSVFRWLPDPRLLLLRDRSQPCRSNPYSAINRFDDFWDNLDEIGWILESSRRIFFKPYFEQTPNRLKWSEHVLPRPNT